MPDITGQLEDFSLLEDAKATTNITFTAFQPDRYEVRALLYGFKVAIMEGHAAKFINAGSEDIKIPFELSKLPNQAFVGPYEIGNVRLYDQGQLASLDESD